MGDYRPLGFLIGLPFALVALVISAIGVVIWVIGYVISCVCPCCCCRAGLANLAVDLIKLPFKIITWFTDHIPYKSLHLYPAFWQSSLLLNMVGLSFYVGIAGNIISVLLFLSPVGTFKRILKKKSTEEFESFPYICTLLSSSLWTYYGLTRPGSILVATINGFGILVEITYISIFLIYASPTMKVKTMTLVGILNLGFPITAILATGLALDREMRIDAIGFVCAGLNIIMYGSPLAAMKTVVMTRSVEYMPFWLSFFVFLNSGIWTIYAVMVDDWFLGVPNGTGCILGIAQLALYAIYKRSKPSTSTDHDDMAQHDPLICSDNQSIEPVEIRMEL